MMALAAALGLGVLSLQANGISIGLMIILLGFAGCNRVLLGLGVYALLLYVSAYYYFLDATLLEKSLTLLVIGVVLLLTRWGFVRSAFWKREFADG